MEKRGSGESRLVFAYPLLATNGLLFRHPTITCHRDKLGGGLPDCLTDSGRINNSSPLLLHMYMYGIWRIIRPGERDRGVWVCVCVRVCVCDWLNGLRHIIMYARYSLKQELSTPTHPREANSF